MRRRRRPAAVGRILATGAAVGTFGFAVTAMASTPPAPAPAPVAVAASAPPREHWVFIEFRHHPAPVAGPASTGVGAPTGVRPSTRTVTSAPAASAPAASAPAAPPTPPPTIRVAPTPTPTVATTGAS